MSALPADFKRAAIDTIIARGEPIATFGPAGRIAAEQGRADLAAAGIDYERSVLGDLGGESWTRDTYAQAAAYPGLWADVVTVGERVPRSAWRPGERWFLGGEGVSFGDILAEILDRATASTTEG